MFSKDTFAFLTELKAHNERPWFEKNKPRYETSVKAPMQALMAELEPRLRKVSKHIVVDPRPVGGSMMRIYRDIRFSKDKSPYKTHMSAMFWNDAGEEEAAPGFYLHIEPKGSMFGGGIWHPEGKALGRIRDAIVKDSATWGKVTSGLLKQSACGMIGESLKRPPPGYDPEHPFIDDLKRKDFGLSMALKDEQVLSPKFAQTVEESARRMAPFMSFLAKAVGAPY